MANNRTPKSKARVSGADLNHPARFKDRKAPASVRDIGEPYARMTDAQKACWQEFRAEMPWLHSAHRTLLRLACNLAARMETDPEFGVQATQALGSLLSKLGATPVDECRVNHGDGDDDDPADRFFTRAH